MKVIHNKDYKLYTNNAECKLFTSNSVNNLQVIQCYVWQFMQCKLFTSNRISYLKQCRV